MWSKTRMKAGARKTSPRSFFAMVFPCRAISRCLLPNGMEIPGWSSTEKPQVSTPICKRLPPFSREQYPYTYVFSVKRLPYKLSARRMDFNDVTLTVRPLKTRSTSSKWRASIPTMARLLGSYFLVVELG